MELKRFLKRVCCLFLKYELGKNQGPKIGFLKNVKVVKLGIVDTVQKTILELARHSDDGCNIFSGGFGHSNSLIS